MNNGIIILAICLYVCHGCLITNCPRGGKRGGKFNALDGTIKPCVSCGPGRTGQCFGPDICCGPFGCLVGTSETARCQRDGMFHEREPCTAGNGSCRKNTGRCASEGVCCTQESCHVDKTCNVEDKSLRLMDGIPMDSIYGLINNYQQQILPAEYVNDNAIV